MVCDNAIRPDSCLLMSLHLHHYLSPEAAAAAAEAGDDEAEHRFVILQHESTNDVENTFNYGCDEQVDK